MKAMQLIIVLLVAGSLCLIAGVEAQAADAFEVKTGEESLFKVDTSGNLTVKGNVINGYGEMYIYNNSTALSSVGTSFVQITGFAAGEGIGWSLNSNALQAASGSAGKYLATFSASFKTGRDEGTYELALFIGDTHQTKATVVRYISRGIDVGVVAGSAIFSISDFDLISLKVRDTGSTSSVTIVHANVSLHRL